MSHATRMTTRSRVSPSGDREEQTSFHGEVFAEGANRNFDQSISEPNLDLAISDPQAISDALQASELDRQFVSAATAGHMVTSNDHHESRPQSTSHPQSGGETTAHGAEGPGRQRSPALSSIRGDADELQAGRQQVLPVGGGMLSTSTPHNSTSD
jgi:hypothetical protein